MTQNFDITPHRQFFQGEEHFEPRSLHLRPADADKSHLLDLRANGLYQVRAQQITRGFSRNDAYGGTCASIHGRAMAGVFVNTRGAQRRAALADNAARARGKKATSTPISGTRP